MEIENVLFAFALTLFAGLSTGIGSALAFFTKRTNTRFLAFSLGLSAGVMIYVSMVEIFFKAQKALQADLGERMGAWVTVVSFFLGILGVMLIDKFVPSHENPHEMHRIEEIRGRAGELGQEHSLMRMGILTALAIAIHNIPEGIAVSVPIYYATGSRRKAFNYSFLSGVSEPIGALLAWLVLAPFLSGALFGVIFASVAGIMVFISVDQLLPAARKYGEHHVSIYGLVIGMMIMAVSLLLFI